MSYSHSAIKLMAMDIVVCRSWSCGLFLSLHKTRTGISFFICLGSRCVGSGVTPLSNLNQHRIWCESDGVVGALHLNQPIKRTATSETTLAMAWNNYHTMVPFTTKLTWDRSRFVGTTHAVRPSVPPLKTLVAFLIPRASLVLSNFRVTCWIISEAPLWAIS